MGFPDNTTHMAPTNKGTKASNMYVPKNQLIT